MMLCGLRYKTKKEFITYSLAHKCVECLLEWLPVNSEFAIVREYGNLYSPWSARPKLSYRGRVVLLGSLGIPFVSTAFIFKVLMIENAFKYIAPCGWSELFSFIHFYYWVGQHKVVWSLKSYRPLLYLYFDIGGKTMLLCPRWKKQ